jgi:hypothetical protein
MSEFSADWLTLREAADARARATDLLDALMLTDAVARNSPQRQFTEILDLGAGTGANLRYLAPRLGSGQRWRCIDRNPALLASLPHATAAWAHRHEDQVDVELERDRLRFAGPGWNGQARMVQRDLAFAPSPTAASQSTPQPASFPLTLAAGSLMTTSALLDLVCEDWLSALISSARSKGCALLFALSYDGRSTLTPARPEDQAVNQLVNQHQRGDKGFGAALGPTAPDAAESMLAAAGYWWRSANSDWQIGPDEPELQKALIAGWIEAALELGPPARGWLSRWQRTRQAQIETGRLQIQVGHRDLIALPPGQRLPEMSGESS